MNRILVDSDVLLDVLMERQPFVVASARVLSWTAESDHEGMVAGHAITNMFYILRRKVGRQDAIRLLSEITQILSIASITESVINQALKSNMVDFEDAVTSMAAEANGAEALVTRNIPDFVKSQIPALSPDQFLQQLSLKND